MTGAEVMLRFSSAIRNFPVADQGPPDLARGRPAGRKRGARSFRPLSHRQHGARGKRCWARVIGADGRTAQALSRSARSSARPPPIAKKLRLPRQAHRLQWRRRARNRIVHRRRRQCRRAAPSQARDRKKPGDPADPRQDSSTWHPPPTTRSAPIPKSPDLALALGCGTRKDCDAEALR